ncbi:MAG TPA: hypothetical protein VMU50_22935 [Polyangia bacterium]|nr:hypothetical protein [Polyangia bacterium]
MKKVLLLDYDHTLYPSTLPTLKAVDDRINLYIRTFLGLDDEAADATRARLLQRHGTTLKGLQESYGVDRDHYCEFIHAIDDAALPPPDPALRAWLGKVAHPFYLFTNARRDWVERGFGAMGMSDLLPATGEEAGTRTPPGPRLRGIFDITFTDWEGKPHPPAYAKVDAHLRARHGQEIDIHFADDRVDNLQAARDRGWRTIWIVPHNAAPELGAAFDRVLLSLTHLDPLGLV